MHEIAMMKNLVGILDREVTAPEVGQVRKVHLEVGELKYIVPEILISAFENIPKNEKLEGAELKLEIVPVKVKCDDCGSESVVERNLFRCAECSGNNVAIVSGKEFNLKGIEW
ncbi:MAG: hydrogenase maturation nickel metallochaperone HypA [Candidatus Omnitrophota bacterium]